MDESIQDAHKRILVISEQLHGDFRCFAEDAFHPGHSQRIDEVLRQSERYPLGYLEQFSLK